MKHRIFCMLLSGVLALTALTACGKTETAAPTGTEAAAPTETAIEAATAADEIALPDVAPTEAQTDAAADDEYAGDETRTLAYYAGIYGAGRCTIRVNAVDATTAKISITWGSSAWEMTEWEMTGHFLPDTYRLTYSDCVKTDVTFADDGSETRTVVYEDGVGRFQLAPDHSMQWQDEQENAGADMQFAYSPDPVNQ